MPVAAKPRSKGGPADLLFGRGQVAVGGACRRRAGGGVKLPDSAGRFGGRSHCLRTGRPGRPGFSRISLQKHRNHESIRMTHRASAKNVTNRTNNGPQTTDRKRRRRTTSLSADSPDFLRLFLRCASIYGSHSVSHVIAFLGVHISTLDS